MKKLVCISAFLALALLSVFSLRAITPRRVVLPVRSDTIEKEHRVQVPLAGNTWEAGTENHGAKIMNSGIRRWSDIRDSFTTHVRLAATGTVHLWLRASVPSGNSRLAITIGGKARTVILQGTGTKDFAVGSWRVTDTGYISIHIRGLTKKGTVFGDIDALLMEGAAIGERTAFVKNNEGNFFYWGKRGPSVHLNYLLAQGIQAEWFYNEHGFSCMFTGPNLGS